MKLLFIRLTLLIVIIFPAIYICSCGDDENLIKQKYINVSMADGTIDRNLTDSISEISRAELVTKDNNGYITLISQGSDNGDGAFIITVPHNFPAGWYGIRINNQDDGEENVLPVYIDLNDFTRTLYILIGTDLRNGLVGNDQLPTNDRYDSNNLWYIKNYAGTTDNLTAPDGIVKKFSDGTSALYGENNLTSHAFYALNNKTDNLVIGRTLDFGVLQTLKLPSDIPSEHISVYGRLWGLQKTQTDTPQGHKTTDIEGEGCTRCHINGDIKPPEVPTGAANSCHLCHAGAADTGNGLTGDHRGFYDPNL